MHYNAGHRPADCDDRCLVRYFGCDKCGTILTMTTPEAVEAHRATHGDRVLTFDEAEAAGFDGTGRDGDPRFPYHLSDAGSTDR